MAVGTGAGEGENYRAQYFTNPKNKEFENNDILISA